jgi:hypothetical protein
MSFKNSKKKTNLRRVDHIAPILPQLLAFYWTKSVRGVTREADDLLITKTDRKQSRRGAVLNCERLERKSWEQAINQNSHTGKSVRKHLRQHYPEHLASIFTFHYPLHPTPCTLRLAVGGLRSSSAVGGPRSSERPFPSPCVPSFPLIPQLDSHR